MRFRCITAYPRTTMCLEPGDIISGRYQIISILGRGGFGKTYKAKDIGKPGHPICVVKEIIPPQSQNPKVLQEVEKRFVREANTLSRLGEHSQIPRLFDYFTENGKFYLIQEYIEGHDLTQEISPSQLPLSEKEVIALQNNEQSPLHSWVGCSVWAFMPR